MFYLEQKDDLEPLEDGVSRVEIMCINWISFDAKLWC